MEIPIDNVARLTTQVRTTASSWLLPKSEWRRTGRQEHRHEQQTDKKPLQPPFSSLSLIPWGDPGDQIIDAADT